jgi:23S rRNA (uracil1939-C5)-methyltransferase
MVIEMPSRILKPLYGGTFTSDHAGPFAMVLPGELVDETVPPTILTASPDRIVPGCAHFGACGGCHYQQAGEAAQIAIKQDILHGILTQAGLGTLPAIQSHHAAGWGYRNRIRLRVEADEGAPGRFQVGYSRPGSNEFLPIRMCPIAAPLLWRAAETLVRMAGEDTLCRGWLGSVSEVELFCLPDESRMQMTLLLREPPRREAASFGAMCERLQRELPELAGAGAELDPELSRRVRRIWAGTTWGAAGLAYPVAGRSYWVSRGAFFQVNRFLVNRLVELACAGAAGGLAWDLFAGAGLFTRVLAGSFDRVIAVEAGDVASADLRTASRGGKGERGFEAVQSSTLDFLRAQELQRDRPELVVLDPPRAGLGAEGAELLGRIRSARMTYVSCDPVTLARDLAILTAAGYRIASVDLVDLFPQTFHMETVVRLELAG